MTKQILEEATSDDISRVWRTIPVSQWGNMRMIEKLSEAFHFCKVNTTKEIVLKELTAFWIGIKSNEKNTKVAIKRAAQLQSTVSSVVQSNPVLLIISHNIQSQTRLSLQQSVLQQAYNDAANSLSTDHANNDNSVEPSTKKPKHLKLKPFKKLDYENQLTELNKHFGTSDVLNFSEKTIPRRFSKYIQLISNAYDLNLQLRLTKAEHDLLRKISSCRSKEELYSTVANVEPFSNVSSLPYIKLAVQKLCNLYHNNLLLDSNNNEVWYRSIVYGDLFDYLFAVQPAYITKRSECHSNIIKSLKRSGLIAENIQNIRLDFIFVNTAVAGVGDAMFCEDKPTENHSKKDFMKAQNLREQSLLYWKSLLPYAACLDHLIAISCQFNKLRLTITGTKIMNGITMHSKLKEVNIPCIEQGGTMLADYFATVISVMRAVMKNFQVIETIMNVVQEDNLAFLNGATNESCFRDDSDCSSECSTSSSKQTSSTSVSALPDWKAAERKDRIMKKIDAALESLNECGRSKYVSSSWEDIVFIEKV